MYKVTFKIDSHEDRVKLVEALLDNGYEAKVTIRTEYMPPKCVVEVFIDDSEVE